MQQTLVEWREPGRPVHVALGLGLRAALVSDPIALVLVPLVLRFPSVALESLQAHYFVDFDPARLEQPLIAFALFLGWGFALVGLTLSQMLIIRRTATWMRRGSAAPLDREFADVLESFPTFLAVNLLFWALFLLGIPLLLLPGLAVLYLLGFAPQAAILERAGVLQSFRHSHRLARGQFGRWAKGALLIVLGVFASGMGLYLIRVGLEEAFGGRLPFAVWAALFFAVEWVSILFTVCWTALYLDLAQEAESLADSTLPQAREAAGLEFAPPSDDERERTRWQAG